MTTPLALASGILLSTYAARPSRIEDYETATTTARYQLWDALVKIE